MERAGDESRGRERAGDGEGWCMSRWGGEELIETAVD